MLSFCDPDPVGCWNSRYHTYFEVENLDRETTGRNSKYVEKRLSIAALLYIGIESLYTIFTEREVLCVKFVT
jgi:hypothetical protein